MKENTNVTKLKEILKKMNADEKVINHNAFDSAIESLINEDEIKRLTNSPIYEDDNQKQIKVTLYLDTTKETIQIGVNRWGEINCIRSCFEDYKIGPKYLKRSNTEFKLSEKLTITTISYLYKDMVQRSQVKPKFKVNNAYFYPTERVYIEEKEFLENGLLFETQMAEVNDIVLSNIRYPSIQNITEKYAIKGMRRVNGYLAEVWLHDIEKGTNIKGIFNIDLKNPDNLQISETDSSFPDIQFFEDYEKSGQTIHELSKDEKQIFLDNASRQTRACLKEGMDEPINPNWIKQPISINKKEEPINPGR